MQPNNGARFLNVLFLINIKERAKHIAAQQKPWSELLDYQSYKVPKTAAEAMDKTTKNVLYFRVNYFLTILGTLAASMLFSPSSVVALLGVVAAWIYVFIVRTEPIVLGGRELSEREKVILLGCLTFVFVFYITKTGVVLMTGIALGVCAVLLHAAAKTPDELFLYDETNAGFFSFLHVPK